MDEKALMEALQSCLDVLKNKWFEPPHSATKSAGIVMTVIQHILDVAEGKELALTEPLADLIENANMYGARQAVILWWGPEKRPHKVRSPELEVAVLQDELMEIDYRIGALTSKRREKLTDLNYARLAAKITE